MCFSASAKILSKIRHIMERIIRQTIMISTLTRLSACIIKAPIPMGIATISAAIRTLQDIPASSFKPVKILGSARGMMTLKSIVIFDAPNVSAAYIYFLSTFLIPVKVLYTTGKNEQINIMIMGSISFIPIHSIRRGNHPKAGMGYRRLIMGLRALLTMSFHPMITPTKMPATEPQKRPISTLIRLLAKFFPSTPFVKRCYPSFTTAEKGGKKNCPGKRLKRPTISQETINKKTGRNPENH